MKKSKHVSKYEVAKTDFYVKNFYMKIFVLKRKEILEGNLNICFTE